MNFIKFSDRRVIDVCVTTLLRSVFVLSFLSLFFSFQHALAVSSFTPIVTLGDGSDATSTVILGPGYTATTSNLFTLKSSTSSAVISNVVVDLNGGSRNDGITWVSRTSASNNYWTSVTYGNGLFVAVASSTLGAVSAIMTSPDGITWTTRAAPANNTWNSVTYGNGLFVAVSASSTSNQNVMTSGDGVTWTLRTGTTTNTWNGVAFGNDLFVAVGSTGVNRVMTSPDGVTWTNRVNAAGIMYKSVTYANGLFVSVASSGVLNHIMTSPEGITWTTRTSSAMNGWQSITYGNGVFVAVANNGVNNGIMRSVDGITWATSTTALNGLWSSVTYGNGIFVAVAATTSLNSVITSTDGNTWTVRAGTTTNSWSSVTYGNGMFVAVSTTGTGNRVMTSTSGAGPQVAVGTSTGQGWATSTSAADNWWNSVAYGNGIFVAVSQSGTGNRVMTSPDGITWTSRVSAADNSWKSVTYGNGLFVAVSGAVGINNNVMTSPDGITWTSRVSAADNSWRSVVYGNGKFVAVANTGTGNRIMTSSDGITWATSTGAASSTVDNLWQSITYGNGLFVAVSATTTSNLSVLTSSDGNSWILRTGATTRSWNEVTYGNGLFVAVTGTTTNQNVMTSSDGITWAQRTGTTTNAWISVTYGNGLFVAVSASVTGDRVMTSSNGINWTSRASIAEDGWRSVVYGNRKFVAVGQSSPGNRVMSSDTFYNNSEFYKGISRVEITNALGTTVYGSVDNPSSDQISIPLSTNTLTATSGPTQYSIRITPKTHDIMPAASVGETYSVKAKVRSFTSALGVVEGEDTVGTTVAIDNLSTGIVPYTTNWTSRLTGVNNIWESVTFGNGLFVAVGGAGSGNRVMTSPDGVTWTSRTSAVDNFWTSVTYANSLFVAVANTGTNRVMTSPDGITWTARTSAAEANSWRSVTYGNGLFVAVSTSGTGNRVMTSPDGTTWTSRASAADNVWYSVTYGNGLFVAVAASGSGNRVMTSPDGITWTSRASAADNGWLSVTYGKGLFVAVSDSTFGTINNRVMTSSNGITWTAQTAANNFTWESVTYAQNYFFAISSFGSMSSNDGMLWSSSTIPEPGLNFWQEVTYGNGILTAVANVNINNRIVLTSSSYTISPSNNRVALTFTTPSDPDLSSILVLKSTDPVGDIPLENTTYATTSKVGASDVVCSFAVATSTTYTCNSTFNTFNGTSYYFKMFSRDSYGNYSSAVMTASTTPGRSITIGTGADTASSTLLPGATATTSNTFTLVTDQGADNLQSVTVTFATGAATTTSLLEITNDTGSQVYGSTTTPSDVTVLPLTGLTVTTATTTYRIRITPKSHANMPDPSVGITTLLTTRISDWTGTNIINKNGSDAASTILTIDNLSPTNVDEAGKVWRNRGSSLEGSSSYSIAYGGGLFVAVFATTTNRNVMTSSDGITWTLLTGTTTNAWTSVTYGNGLFVAVACGVSSTTCNAIAGNRVMTSPDGVAWTLRTSSATNEWRSVTYGNGLFVAVASAGTNRVMTSPDGITWTLRTSAVESNSWYSVAYGKGKFVAVAQAGSLKIMSSLDGITWTSESIPNEFLYSLTSITYANGLFVVTTANNGGGYYSSGDTNWIQTSISSGLVVYNSVAYGNGFFVAAGGLLRISTNGISWSSPSYPNFSAVDFVTFGSKTFVARGTLLVKTLMTSSSPTATSSSNQITLTFINPADTDISTTTILRSTSPITDTPVEGVSYATSSSIGASTVACSFAVTASSTRTCTNTGLVNGTPYYFKLFTQDTTGNWSTGVALDPVAPGATGVTLGTGNDPVGGTLAPGSSATTSNTFTFQATPVSDIIQAATVTFATGTAQALSLVEITSDNGATVYGSAANPSTDIVPITLSTNTLTANTSLTQYRVRVTPKSHVNMPAIPGSTYYVSSYVSSFVGTSAYQTGQDLAATTLTIDNSSPSTVDEAGRSWRSRVSAANNNWNSVTYGNGLFVAVSGTTTNQSVMTSSDGVIWNLRTATTTNTWQSVTYGNGLFVAVASAGTNRVMTSPDGITWTARTSAGEANQWQSVTYGNGLFVAVANFGTNRVMTSPDGITWTPRNSSATEGGTWLSITYGKNLFVAVAQSGTSHVMTSVDGVTWVARTSVNESNAWFSVTYGNGLFVAVANSGTSRIMTSQDAVTWTAQTSTSTEAMTLTSVTYGNGLFVAISTTGVGKNYMITSSNGVVWSLRAVSAVNSWRQAIYGDSLFVTVSTSGSGDRVMTSSNPTATSSSNQITLTFINPADTDISTTTILRSTSPITDTPVEGVSYATSSSIGASTVACSFAVTASSTRTCTNTGLVNGTPYYFKLFVQDTTGNWSTGVEPFGNPVSPGATGVTLGVGTDTPSTTLAPGGNATTSNTFTFQTTSGTDIIPSLTLTFASGTTQALSLVEITHNSAATVYGSASNPSSDIVPITLSTNTLTANTSLTQYRVRVTTKVWAAMPAPPGSTYYVSSYVSSFNTTAAYKTGTDLGGGTTTIITIDNESPASPTSGTGEVTAAKQILLTYTNPSTTDASSTVVLRSTSPVTDVPAGGQTYSAGNTIGAATVVCVANTITLSAIATCLDTTAGRSTNYYYKIYTKDSAGNYSTGLTFSGLPLYIQSPKASAPSYVEPESSSGATTTQSGGGVGGGGGGEGGGGGATTTQGGGGQGGGGGDSGFIYHGSNIASLIRNSLGMFFTGFVYGGTDTAQAEEDTQNQAICSLKVFGICFIRAATN